MNSAILEDIRTSLPRLSKSESRVGDWLLGNAHRAIDVSINEVAMAAQVSEPTVIRFCRSLGLSGFRELRTHLIAALQKPRSYLHNDVSADDAPTSAAIKVLESSIHALVGLRESIARMPFEPATALLAAARQIVFVGLGASGHVAGDACHKFFRLGLPCTTALDAPTIIQQAAIADARDVFVAISHTGAWPELIEAMSLAVSRGAGAIALTDVKSKLAAVATCTFDCNPVEDTNLFTPMSSRLAHLTVLDALQVTLALGIGMGAERNLKLTKEALNQNRARHQP